MTKELAFSLLHVKKFHPDVCIVVILEDGTWRYFDENLLAPVFDKNIDVSILEKGADSIIDLPFIYQI